VLPLIHENFEPSESLQVLFGHLQSTSWLVFDLNVQKTSFNVTLPAVPNCKVPDAGAAVGFTGPGAEVTVTVGAEVAVGVGVKPIGVGVPVVCAPAGINESEKKNNVKNKKLGSLYKIKEMVEFACFDDIGLYLLN